MIEVLAPTMIAYATPRSGRGDGAAAAARPRAVVPGVLRTRLRQRPRLTDHQRRAPRRRLGGHRAEGVDQPGPVRGALCPAHPHRSAGTPTTTRSPRSSSTWTTPGITVRPLRTMHGVDEFCEVFFDDVVVPADRMLGDRATVGGSRWICSRTSAPPASGTASPTSTRVSTNCSPRPHRQRRGRRRRRPRCRLPGSAHHALPVAGARSTASPRAANSGRRPPSTRCCSPPPSSSLFDTARDLLPGVDRARRFAVARRIPVLARRDDLRRHRRDPAQHHRAPAARPRERVNRGCCRTRPAGSDIAQDDAGRLGRGSLHRAHRPGLARHARRSPIPLCPWSFGCSVRPVRTHRCSTTSSMPPPVGLPTGPSPSPSPGAPGSCGNTTAHPTRARARRRPADPTDIDGRRDPARRGPSGAGLVADRREPGDAHPRPHPCRRPGPVRSSGGLVPGHPAPTRRDPGRRRRRRSDPRGRRRRPRVPCSPKPPRARPR